MKKKMKKNILALLTLAAFLPLASVAQTVDIPAKNIPTQIEKNRQWQFPAQPDKKITADLEKVLQDFQKQSIKFEPITKDDAICNGREKFTPPFQGFLQASGYYYLLGHLYDGQYAYFNSDAKPVDYFLKNLNLDVLKKFANLAIKSMSAEQKKDLLAFANALNNHYQPFFKTLTDQNLMAYTIAKDQMLDKQFYEFGGLPKPEKSSCYGEEMMTSPTIKADFFGGSTYFSYYSFSFDSYLYSFWYRRFYHGTEKEAKELLDYVIEQLAK